MDPTSHLNSLSVNKNSLSVNIMFTPLIVIVTVINAEDRKKQDIPKVFMKNYLNLSTEKKKRGGGDQKDRIFWLRLSLNLSLHQVQFQS